MKKNHIWMTAIAIIAAAIMITQRGQRVRAQDSGAQGAGATMMTPITVIARDLPVAGAGAQGPVRMKVERSIIPEEQMEAAKARAAAGGGPQLPATLGFSSPQVSGAGASGDTPIAVVNFDGEFQGDAGCGNWIPSDMGLAVGDGTNPVVQLVNECMNVYTLGGVQQLHISLQSLFGLGNVSVCDPRALYDWKNHRFILSVIVCQSPYSASVAVSASDDPTGGWFVYNGFGSLGSPGALMDYDRLGQDVTATYPGSGFPGAIYVAYNLFNPNFVFEEWKVLPKGPMYAGAGFSYWNFWGMSSGGVVTDSSQPANVWSPYELPRAEFFLTSTNNGGVSNVLSVFAISNPFNWVAPVNGDTPELSGPIRIAAANSWAPPPNAPQPGGPNIIETLDNRFTGENSYAHGHLYAAHSSSNGTGGTASLIYEIQPFLNISDGRCVNGTPADTNQCPQIVNAVIRNESLLNYGTTTAAWFAVPQPDLDGNVTTIFDYSNTTSSFASNAYVSQRVTQPLGTFADGGWFLAQGLGTYTGFSNNARWGDYNAVAPIGIGYRAGNGAPTAGNGFVFAAQYADTTANNRWRTRIGANIFTAPSDFTPTQSQ
jgi:hypothetical protein